MNVCLCTLPREGEYQSWITPPIAEPKEVKHLPLGLVSLITNAWEGQVYTMLDPFSEYWTIEQTLKAIQKTEPDVIGFSAVTRRTYALYELLKRTSAKWKIVGGPHCTCHAEEILQHGADAVFVGGLAENEFQKWLWTPVKGIIHCDTDINEISFPRREFVNYKDYLYEGKVIFEAKNRMQMFTSVGCPNRCNFCSVQGKTVHRKLAYNVLSEMWYLKALGSESVHIMDDNFNTSKLHMESILFAMELSRWQTEWSMRGQVKFDLSLVPRMASLGLKRIHVGIESLDDNTLWWMHKNHTVQDIENFCRVMKENNIDILAYFIIGCPTETPGYLKALPENIRSLGITQPYVNILFPQPNTEYYDTLVKSGEYDRDHWKEYFNNPVPDYQIPFPKSVNQDKIDRAEQIIKEFSGL